MSDLWLILPGLMAAGLAGSGHCFGMCGGLAALGGSSGRKRYVLLMNLARIITYTFIGLVGGLIVQLGVSSSEQLLQLSKLGNVSRIISGILLLLLALGVVGWRWDQAFFGQLPALFWAKIQPISRRLLPINRSKDALLLGALWGWLPCGLVYAVLPVAWLRADALESGLMLFCFGLGTLPSMLAMGLASTRIRLLLKKPKLKWFLAGSILLAALWLLVLPLFSLFDINTGHHH